MEFFIKNQKLRGRRRGNPMLMRKKCCGNI
jgi:hypothetical protein